ncbi:hypothetical protein QZH36_15910 [Erwinia sp. BC051422]|uniref:hypothetical protein n=1 Tax=Erwinia wuhanensis TaxID=3045167 RepID=UPI00265449C7|nr:hypothetical protein [Erwinia sp. BC051422]MDN8542906.1 hypothetical protein [Erwinia sp. BC051422]
MAIRTGIIGKEARTLLPGRERKKVAAVLAEKVVPAMQMTLPGQLLPAHYPWCFILPPLRKKGRCYVGALVNSRAAGLSAIYAAVSVQWLQKELASDFHIAFWLARIMMAQQNQDGVVNQDIYLKNWVNLLRSRYSPFRERLLNERYRFSYHADLLLAELSEYDRSITEEKGVGSMPWPDWPEIIQTDRKAWLWRQSRYGKIIDSQHIIC